MKEISVQFAPRYMKRKWSDAIGKSLLKTLTEPVTNSDDSYNMMESMTADKNVLPITIFIDKDKRLIKIIDQAQGMTSEELEAKFKEYGAAKSGAYKGYNTRGIFGQGISDVLFYHKNGQIKSIKNGEASICFFYEKNNKPYIKVEKQKNYIGDLSKKWEIENSHGTVVEFILDKSTPIHDYENLVKKLRSFYMLRLINSNKKRIIKIVFKDKSGLKNSILNYEFPKGEKVEHKEFIFRFEKYKPVVVEVDLYKSESSLQSNGEDRESGILVYDDKDAIYAQTFFGLDNLPNTDKFFGFMKLNGAREIILNKINKRKHPEAILSDSRDGFNTQHEFYKKLSIELRDWLHPILNEERRKKSDEGISDITIEKHKKAFEELNKLYNQLTGEENNGVISDKTKGRPAGGISFARKQITITSGKKYGLQLLIDTKIIGVGSKILLKSHNNNVGYLPKIINIENDAKDNDNILIKTVTIVGYTPRTADTIEAICEEKKASVVISVVPEEVVYPSNGLIFNPDHVKIVPNHESTIHLFIDLDIIKIGNEVTINSSNESIKTKYSKIVISENIKIFNNIGKMDIVFWGEKDNQDGCIKASYGQYNAQCEIEIKKRAEIKQPIGSMGKFKGWDFDETVPKMMQTTYDSFPSSPTQGYILINPYHPINRYYFGDNPQKKDIESSNKSQLYLAELILNESLGAIVPEAYKKGMISANYGPEYDIPVYIAQKKFDLGPLIYGYFVEEKSKRETIIENQKLNIEQENVLEKHFGELNDRQRKIMDLRFGLNGQRQHTLEEIAIKFSITRERVRQIINSIFSKVKPSSLKDFGFENIDIEIGKITGKGDIVNKIFNIVEKFYKVKIKDIKSKTRKAEIVNIRQIVIYLLCDSAKLNYSHVGRIFNLDHTTVLHSFDKIKREIENNNILKKQISLMGAIIEG
jgi:hypothetical protein